MLTELVILAAVSVVALVLVARRRALSTRRPPLRARARSVATNRGWMVSTVGDNGGDCSGADAGGGCDAGGCGGD